MGIIMMCEPSLTNSRYLVYNIAGFTQRWYLGAADIVGDNKRDWRSPVKFKVFLFGLIVLVTLLACVSTSTKVNRTFSLTNYRAMPGSQGGESAVYLTIVNSTGQADTLVSATSPAAEVAEVHTMVDQDGKTVMQPVAGGIAIKGTDIVNLAPGGDHIMLVGLKEELLPGQRIKLVFHFESGKELSISVPVKE